MDRSRSINNKISYGLIFTNKINEEEYLLQLRPHLKMSINLLLLAAAFVSTYGNLIGKSLEEFSWFRNGLTILVCLLFLLAVYFLVKKNKIRWLELLICVLTTAFIVAPSEVPKAKWNGTVYYCIGNSVQLFSCFLLFSRVRFKMCVPFYVFYHLYPVWRMGSYEQLKEMLFYPVVVNLFIMTLLIGNII